MQHQVLVITQREQGLRRGRLQFLSILQSAFGSIASRGGVGSSQVKERVRTRKSRPSQRKVGVKLDRLLIRIDGFVSFGQG